LYWDVQKQNLFAPLKTKAWLPGSKSFDRWFTATEVYNIFRKFLFESQGNFLAIDQATQGKGSDFIKFLAIETEPLPELVVRHLLCMSKNGDPLQKGFYEYLTKFANDKAIKFLIGKPCLFIETNAGGNVYLRPDQVFWEEHPFGNYRARLSASWGQYKSLLDQLGVKDHPDAEDAISVLLEIAREFGTSNLRLDDNPDVETIIIHCWKLLSEALTAEKVDPNRIKTALGERKTIPNDGHLLIFPTKLFFEDRPGWGSKFTVVKNNLTKRFEGAWPAMEAAGVQRLSKAITTEVHLVENGIEDDEFLQKIRERSNLIRRVIQAHGDKGVSDFDFEKLLELEFVRADKVEVIRLFTGFNSHEPSQFESVDAIYLKGTLYYCAINSHKPWQAIARELAYVLHPSGELNSLGMELKEILSQSIQDANATLDDYGYPKIEEAPTQVPDGAAAEPAVAPTAPGAQVGDTPGELPAGKDGGDGHPSTGGGVPPGGTQVGKKEKPVKRKTSRLYSYVNPEEETSSHTESEETTQRRLRTGQLGVDRVMQYERVNGRTPTDMETVKVHHPGYDIESIDSIGRPRYIEVKTMTGQWDSQSPAQMTKIEFETAKELGTSYWLYIVEMIESDKVKMYMIQDPANRADIYCFDYGWKGISIEKE